MSSENYRYYRLDGLGNLYEAEWLHAIDDEAAVKHIEKTHSDSKCEIWIGTRLVAELPKPLSVVASSPCSGRLMSASPSSAIFSKASVVRGSLMYFANRRHCSTRDRMPVISAA